MIIPYDATEHPVVYTLEEMEVKLLPFNPQSFQLTCNIPVLILEHGATGTDFYNTISFWVMNKQSPKGIIFTTGLDEDDVVMGCEDKIFEATKELDMLYRPDFGGHFSDICNRAGPIWHSRGTVA